MAFLIASGDCAAALPDGTVYSFTAGEPVEVADGHAPLVVASKRGWYRQVSAEEAAGEPKDSEKTGSSGEQQGDDDQPSMRWTAAQLQAECATRGLSAEGTKAELLARLGEVREPGSTAPDALLNERIG